MNHIAWHAGSSKWNAKSIGVEVSNAWYPKYQKWYLANGHGERPIVTDAKVHGKKLPPFMDFYPIQVEALKALMKAVHKATDIPLKCPLDKAGKTSYNVSTSAARGSFKGYLSHFNLTRRKIDCANLDLKKLLEDIK